MRRPQLAAAFAALFEGEPATIARAPGRVNLIGEHVDYSDGLVLPLAIDRFCHVAAAPRPDGILRIYSVQLDETVEVQVERRAEVSRHWSDYVAGVAWSLGRARRPVAGADLLVDSEIPIGAGLGSSAALEVAAARALLDLSGETLGPVDLALVCQRAENEYVGARVGIMDQLTSCAGVAGHALLIDCRSLDTQPVALDESEVAVVVANTMVRHDLTSGAYNERRAECEAVVTLLAESRPEVRSMRDVTSSEIERETRQWPDHLRRRAHHVTTEIERVTEAAQALGRRDYEEFGRLMDESHGSLRNDYEVSCLELDTMAQLARDLGAYGARLTGGGFGGCVVSLVAAGKANAFIESLAASYRAETSIAPDVWLIRSADGATSVR